MKGKERTRRRTERTAEVNGSRLLIGTSQLPAASRLAYAHLVCSLSSLVSPSCSHAALSPAIPFSSVTSRFTSAVSHFDTRRNVSGRWEASSTRALLMDSILYQIGNRLVAVVVIRGSAR